MFVGDERLLFTFARGVDQSADAACIEDIPADAGTEAPGAAAGVEEVFNFVALETKVARKAESREEIGGCDADASTGGSDAALSTADVRPATAAICSS